MQVDISTPPAIVIHATQEGLDVMRLRAMRLEVENLRLELRGDEPTPSLEEAEVALRIFVP